MREGTDRGGESARIFKVRRLGQQGLGKVQDGWCMEWGVRRPRMSKEIKGNHREGLHIYTFVRRPNETLVPSQGGVLRGVTRCYTVLHSVTRCYTGSEAMISSAANSASDLYLCKRCVIVPASK